MATNIAEVRQNVGSVLEQVVIGGDLSKLSPAERVKYYNAVCESIGVNPLTKPFDYITLNNKLTLYAKRDCTDQLRNIKGVSVTLTDKKVMNDVYLVSAHATDKNGRTDESTGAVSIAGLKGDALANAYMKAETKAKRRVTLSICGLGILDESEVETVPGARQEQPPPRPARIVSAPPHDPQTGEINDDAVVLPTPGAGAGNDAWKSYAKLLAATAAESRSKQWLVDFQVANQQGIKMLREVSEAAHAWLANQFAGIVQHFATQEPDDSIPF